MGNAFNPNVQGVTLWRWRTGVCEMTVKRMRLCYWIARPAKPGVQSSNTSRVRFIVISHTPGRFRFYHMGTYLNRTELRWRLPDEFNTTKLLIFQIRNLFHCIVEYWWNMPFKGTRHGDAVAYVIVATLIRLFSIVMSRGLNTYCDVTQCMNGIWIFIAKLESPKGDS